MPTYTSSLHLLYCVLLAVSLLAPARSSEAVFGADSQAVLPLPEGCGGVTPPGSPEPLCCISGFVYGDGQPLEQAGIWIKTSGTTQLLSTTTQLHSGDETRPYYRLSLSDAPFNVVPGETITVTARYSGHEQSMRYRVQSGGQQVDLVLPPRQMDDYIFERHIATSSELQEPQGVAYDSQGRIYVLDTGASRVKIFDSSGSLLNEWGDTGAQPGQLEWPGGIAIGPADGVYIADTQNHRIQKFSADGSLLQSFGSQGSDAGQFNYPEGLAVDAIGNIYVADTENHRIQKFNDQGSWLASWGSYGSASGQLNGPVALALDQQGNIYVVDRRNNRIQKFSSTGLVLTSWGGSGSAVGKLFNPRGIALDSSGHVFVADNGNYRVQKFSSAGAVLANWGGNGPANGLFGTIYGLSVTSDGHVLVVDSHSKRVDIFRPMTATRPIATISSIPSTHLAPHETLIATGMGADSDSTQPISAYRWVSDRQGLLSESAILSYPASRLLPGEHQLSFSILDAQGQWSVPIITRIFIVSKDYHVFLPYIVH